MNDHKPNNLTVSLRGNPNYGISFLGKLPHRLSIETKLLVKAGLVQPKHRINVSRLIAA